MRRKIDFFIVGAQKSGTTSLHHYLAQHPRLFLPYRKEIEYFVDEVKYRELERHLTYDYPADIREDLVGLSYAELLFFEFVPERLRAHNVDARILAVLRNPIDRAYSAYWHWRRVGREPCETFEHALERDSTTDYTTLLDRGHFCYLEHGHYAEQLKRFRRCFPQEQLHVLLFEDFQRDANYLDGVLSWLGIGDANFRPDQERHNVASMPRLPQLEHVLRDPASPVHRFYKTVMPARLRYFLGRRVVDRLSRANLRPFRYPPMQEKTRDRLRTYFEPHNERLASLLGRDLSHWT
jgi:hypothetical protein